LAGTPEDSCAEGDPLPHEPLINVLWEVSGSAPTDSPALGSPPSASFTTGDGCLISFGTYLRLAAQPQPSSAHWRSSAIADARGYFPHGERGTVALVTTEDGAEAAPGISLAVQIVPPGKDTLPHRHAFWHLYFVVSGGGTAYIGDAGGEVAAINERAYPLAIGDALYVSPWAAHRLVNTDPCAPFVLYALQNLPQLAALGTLVRDAPGGGIEHVYRARSSTSYSS